MHGDEKQRININVPVETLERIDKYAKKMSINRTSAILVLVTTALDTQQTMSDLSELMKFVDEERKKQNQTEQTNK